MRANMLTLAALRDPVTTRFSSKLTGFFQVSASDRIREPLESLKRPQSSGSAGEKQSDV